MKYQSTEEQINELVDKIKSQNFEGTEEEIKLQQILYFDKYVKENIDYGFEAVNFSLLNPDKKNPYDSAYRINGFFDVNEATGKKLAVCGSISQVAKIVFDRLGIECDYVWGHINSGSVENPVYIGHRWNIVKIGNKNFMVDFTMEMVINNIGKDKNYDYAFSLFTQDEIETVHRFLFFDQLCEKESIGGFKEGSHCHEDDYDENGHLRNITFNAYEKYPNLSKLSPEFINSYYSMMQSKKL